LQQLLARTPPAGQVATPVAPSAPIPWRQWRVWVVKAHHLFIVGNTDSGKTTLARALLPGKRGIILVVDPKNRPGKWGRIAAIGLDDDAEYTQIEQALQMVLAELRQRQRALNRGAADFTPLTVVVDEVPDVADECPTFPKLFKRVGSIGRELHISLIALSQRSTVQALKIHGDGQSRDNFTKIRMGSFAHQVVPALAGQRHCAVVERDGEQHVLDVSPLPVYAQLPLQAGVVSGIATRDTSFDTRDTSLDTRDTSPDTSDTRYVPGMDENTPGMRDDTSLDTRDTRYVPGMHTTPIPGIDTRDTRYVPGMDTSPDTSDTRYVPGMDTSRDTRDTSPIPGSDTSLDDDPTDEQIRAWAAAGVSRRKIKERLRGTQQQRQERINQVFGPDAAAVVRIGGS
jgi:energy-coupling factor transporter ATP-binding protein EcfA2